jgi:hypothetical protein
MPPTHHISNANRHWPSKGSALKPNGRKRIADQTEMLLFIAGKKTKEAAAKLCARSRWFTFSQKNETKVTAGGSSSSISTVRRYPIRRCLRIFAPGGNAIM